MRNSELFIFLLDSNKLFAVQFFWLLSIIANFSFVFRLEYMFEFNDKFEVQDDFQVLTKIGMLMGKF